MTEGVGVGGIGEAEHHGAVGDEALHAIGEGFSIVEGIKEAYADICDNLGVGPCIRGDDGESAQHILDGDPAEGFALGGHDAYVHAIKQGVDVVALPIKDNMIFKAFFSYKALYPIDVVRLAVAYNGKGEMADTSFKQ